MLRAAELALSEFEDSESADLVRLFDPPPRDLEHLAAVLSRAGGVIARVRAPSSSTVKDVVLAGGAVLLPLEDAWLVGGGRRITLVSSDGEQRRSLSSSALRRLMGTEGHQGIVLEQRHGLEPLSARRTGSKSPWARLRSLVSIEARSLVALVVYAIVLGGLSLAVPLAVQVLINTIAFGSLAQPLVVLAVLLLGVLSFSALVAVVQWYVVEVLQRRTFVRVSEDLARRLVAVRLETHDHLDAHELLNRFFEVPDLQKTISRLLLDGLGLVLQTLVGLVLLAFYHPTLLAFAVCLVVSLGLVIALGYGAVPTAMAESGAKYRVAAWLETLAAAPIQFKRRDAALFGAIRADALTREYLAARRRHYARIQRHLIGGVIVQAAAMVALLGLGGWLVMRGELTLGQLVAAELVLGIVGSGFAKLGKYLESGYDLLASLDKLGKIIDLPLDERGPSRPGTRAPLALELRGLHPRAGLSPVDVEIPARSRVLLDGAGGAGKSTLLEILAGLRSPHAGSVELAAPARRDELPERAMLLRPLDLIDGSVLDNLRVVDMSLSEDDAWALLRSVGLGAVMSRLPDGLQTELFAHGPPLSSSEVARLGVARALRVAPDLLLVDGALDGLGLPEGEYAEVLERVLGPEAPWTAVVVSRSPEVRRRCDTVVTLSSESSS